VQTCACCGEEHVIELDRGAIETDPGPFRIEVGSGLDVIIDGGEPAFPVTFGSGEFPDFTAVTATHPAAKLNAELPGAVEIVFVEGNSTDSTWQVLQDVVPRYREMFPISVLKQNGRGKGDAVRAGFRAAKNDLLMILDGDLTVDPSELPKFYEAVATGAGEFINGSRLVYPMEGQAMQLLNMAANKVFGFRFTWLIGQPIKDTLCGTKVLLRMDEEHIAAGRAYFGDFDPFGDFDLLFGAAKQNLKIIDVPVRYRERVYGETNIHRWRHGWLLLKMCLFAAFRMKFI
jgi:glycosyltransferase involved in cell wall biosynthesis